MTDVTASRMSRPLRERADKCLLQDPGSVAAMEKIADSISVRIDHALSTDPSGVELSCMDLALAGVPCRSASIAALKLRHLTLSALEVGESKYVDDVAVVREIIAWLEEA